MWRAESSPPPLEEDVRLKCASFHTVSGEQKQGEGQVAPRVPGLRRLPQGLALHIRAAGQPTRAGECSVHSTPRRLLGWHHISNVQVRKSRLRGAGPAQAPPAQAGVNRVH